MSARRAALAVVAAVVAGVAAAASPARAAESSRYGPVPPGIAALVGASHEERFAQEAIARVETGRDLRDAIALLVLSGDAGVRRTAERLAAAPTPSSHAVEALLVALDASPRPDVDLLLARAVDEPRFEARAIAAHALGAGRSPLAVEALARFCGDPMPAVRAAALQALFAIDTPQARAARLALPDDRDARLVEMRLRLHRQRGDGTPALRGPAGRAWLAGTTPGVRAEAARCLALAGVETPSTLLALLLLENGTSAAAGSVVRAALDAPVAPAAPGTARLVAAEALVTLLGRPDVPRRDALVRLAVGYLAHPVWVGGTRVDEDARRAILTALPGSGTAFLEPVVSMLEARRFDDPMNGIRLLTTLDEASWLPHVRRFADPRTNAGKADPLVRAAAGALREIGRVGDADVAAALLDASLPLDVRRDGLWALAREDAALALPLLLGALADPRNDAIGSTARDVLLTRREPEVRAALETAVLEPPWRTFDHELFKSLVAAADDAAYALLDRAFRSADEELRSVALDLVRGSRSLRGARAAEMVRRESARPPKGDVGAMGSALASVDGKAAVAYVRRHLPTWRYPGVLLRNLQAVSDPGALDLALEVASRTDDKRMLGEVARVVAGPAGRRAPARTEPFWHRLLSSSDFELVDDALAHLRRVPHGDLSEYVEPILRTSTEPDERRIAALAVLVEPWNDAYRPLLWRIGSDPTEREDLRAKAIRALVAHPDDATRAQAIRWLQDRVDETGSAVEWVGQLAGTGASAADAATLVSILEATIARRFERPPYFRPADADPAYETRVLALTRGIAISHDAAAFDRLANLLFDPRFAAYAREVRRAATFQMPRGGGALSALAPPTARTWLHWSVGLARDTDLDLPAPVPPEVRHVIAAIKSGSPADVGVRVARAVDEARVSGRLAAFDDLYLWWLALDLRHKPHGDFAAAAEAVDAARARALPAVGAEAAWADPRVPARAREGRFAEAADFFAKELAAAARLGSPDLTGTWGLQRAVLDFLQGADAATAGRAEEARDAFRRGLARAPNDPGTLNSAAWFRALAGFDLDAAADDARRALALEKRLYDEESVDSIDTYGLVLLRQGKAAEAREVLLPAVNRLKPESHPQGGEILWRYASASAASGMLREAERALGEALEKYEPTLEPFLRRDPLLEPLKDHLDRIVSDATRLRLQPPEDAR